MMFDAGNGIPRMTCASVAYGAGTMTGAGGTTGAR
jgi:hypothetical protein